MYVVSSKSLKKILGLLLTYFVRTRINGSILGPLSFLSNEDLPKYYNSFYDGFEDGACAFLVIQPFKSGGKVGYFDQNNTWVEKAKCSYNGLNIDSEINLLKSRVTLLETKV